MGFAEFGDPSAGAKPGWTSTTTAAAERNVLYVTSGQTQCKIMMATDGCRLPTSN